MPQLDIFIFQNFILYITMMFFILYITICFFILSYYIYLELISIFKILKTRKLLKNALKIFNFGNIREKISTIYYFCYSYLLIFMIYYYNLCVFVIWGLYITILGILAILFIIKNNIAYCDPGFIANILENILNYFEKMGNRIYTVFSGESNYPTPAPENTPAEQPTQNTPAPEQEAEIIAPFPEDPNFIYGWFENILNLFRKLNEKLYAVFSGESNYPTPAPENTPAPEQPTQNIQPEQEPQTSKPSSLKKARIEQPTQNTPGGENIASEPETSKPLSVEKARTLVIDKSYTGRAPEAENVSVEGKKVRFADPISTTSYYDEPSKPLSVKKARTLIIDKSYRGGAPEEAENISGENYVEGKKVRFDPISTTSTLCTKPKPILPSTVPISTSSSSTVPAVEQPVAPVEPISTSSSASYELSKNERRFFLDETFRASFLNTLSFDERVVYEQAYADFVNYMSKNK